jgi:DNA end-binding protein Ku
MAALKASVERAKKARGEAPEKRSDDIKATPISTAKKSAPAKKTTAKKATPAKKASSSKSTTATKKSTPAKKAAKKSA